jgi:hypothetical protein
LISNSHYENLYPQIAPIFSLICAICGLIKPYRELLEIDGLADCKLQEMIESNKTQQGE